MSRNGLAAIPITLALVTVDGTATGEVLLVKLKALSHPMILFSLNIAGVDYTETNVDVMLNSDDSEQSITIPVLNDIVVESQEFFRVELTIASSQSRIQLGQDSATIVIEDDDSKFRVQLDFSHCDRYNTQLRSDYSRPCYISATPRYVPHTVICCSIANRCIALAAVSTSSL